MTCPSLVCESCRRKVRCLLSGPGIPGQLCDECSILYLRAHDAQPDSDGGDGGLIVGLTIRLAVLLAVWVLAAAALWKVGAIP